MPKAEGAAFKKEEQVMFPKEGKLLKCLVFKGKKESEMNLRSAISGLAILDCCYISSPRSRVLQMTCKTVFVWFMTSLFQNRSTR